MAGGPLCIAGRFYKVYDSSDVRVYFLIRDSYKNAGYMGYHVQPLNAVREALIRDDGREGGILLIVRRDIAKEVEKAIKSIGLPVAYGIMVRHFKNQLLF